MECKVVNKMVTTNPIKFGPFFIGPVGTIVDLL